MKNNLKKCIFCVFVFLGILFIPSGVRAADLKLTYNENWNKCGNSIFVLPSYDNGGNIDGYLYLTSDGVTKQSLDNKIVYKDKSDAVNIDVSVIDSSNTDGYVVKGEADFLITSYDDNDNIVFKKQYGGNGMEFVLEVINSYNNTGDLDGYLAIIGTTSSDLNIESGFALLKLDLEGNVSWIKNINDYFHFFELIYTNNQDVFATVFSDNSVLKTYNAANDVVWEKDTGIIIGNINYSYDKNGKLDGIVVVGYLRDNGYHGVLIKYDLNGNEVFRSTYNDSYSIYYDVTSSYLPDGSYDGYIVTAVFSNKQIVLIKYNLNGDKESEIVYSNDNNLRFTIVNNFDETGKRNGYLLYSTATLNPRPPKREIEMQNQISTPEAISCTDLIVAKYTYDTFPVVKEDDDGGTISVKSDAYPGELVKVKISVKEGYTLARIIVKDENGKEIEVNSDGTFVMPEGKVTVSAIYKRLTNPDTVSAAYMVLGVILVASVGSMIVIKKKNAN